MTVRTAVVVNPAKVRDADALRADVTGVLDGAGWPAPAWYETSEADPGRGAAERAVRDGAGLVFACGGDGTVMACAGALAGTDVTMAVLPAGTGNLLAANLGLPTDLVAAARLAVAGGRRRIDVGVADDRCFTVMAGMGFDAHMLDATPEALKARLGWLAYGIGALRRLVDRPMHVVIRLDDGPPLLRRARTVLVANVGRLQGGIRLLPDAAPDDGLLHVAVLTPRSPGGWLALGAALLRRHRRVPGMEVFGCHRVTVTSDRPQDRELDGDVIAPSRHLRVRIQPRALTLCVPE